MSQQPMIYGDGMVLEPEEPKTGFQKVSYSLGLCMMGENFGR